MKHIITVALVIGSVLVATNVFTLLSMTDILLIQVMLVLVGIVGSLLILFLCMILGVILTDYINEKSKLL